MIFILRCHRADGRLSVSAFRGSRKGLAQAVFYISLIRKMEQLRVVAERDEASAVRPMPASYSHTLQSASLIRGGLNPVHRVGKHIVEHSGRDSPYGLCIRTLLLILLDKPSDSLPRLRGNEEKRSRTFHMRKARRKPFFVNSFTVLLSLIDKIPFVDRDYRCRLARLVCDTGNLLVLFGDPLCRVDRDECRRSPSRLQGARAARCLFLDPVGQTFD